MRRPISPARIRYGAVGGILKKEYCWPTSKCKSEAIWNEGEEDLLEKKCIREKMEKGLGIFIVVHAPDLQCTTGLSYGSGVVYVFSGCLSLG